MQIRLKRIKGFNIKEFKESAKELKNPGCGFYHIYTINALPPRHKISLGEEIWFYDNAENERLALALIDIGAFKSSPLNDEALLRIDAVLDFFRQNNKQIILRFTYDTIGRCIEREPYSISVVKTHIEQTADLIRKYSDDILVNQGLLIGNWGEMHGSKFSDVNIICELADTFYQSTHGKCFLALRTPAQIRTVLHNKNTHSELKGRLALFNDALFASPTDLGTYAESDTTETGLDKKWNRKCELEWQYKTLAYSPNGGEAAAEHNPVGFEFAAREMHYLHTAYLNSAFNKVQLNYWKKEKANEGIWNGTSGYDFIGRHLGYRFFVRDAFLSKGKELNIEVENGGFANLCKSASLIIRFEYSDGTSAETLIDTDPRAWMSGEKTIVKTGVVFKDKILNGSSVYITLKLKNGTPIYFANEGADERLKLNDFANGERA